MKVMLPTRESRVDENGNLKNIDKEVEFELDLSLASQMRFESKCPELAQNEDLYDYMKRVTELKDYTKMAIGISRLKALYCWFDTDMDFASFVKMFSSGDEEYSKKLNDRMNKIFEIIKNGSSEKN